MFSSYGSSGRPGLADKFPERRSNLVKETSHVDFGSGSVTVPGHHSVHPNCDTVTTSYVMVCGSRLWQGNTRISLNSKKFGFY